MKKETLYRYFGNCASEDECREVIAWAQSSPDHLKEFCHERNIYNAILLSAGNIEHTQYDFRRHYRIQLLRIAAVVVLLLTVAFGSFYFTVGDRIVPLYSLTVPAGNSNTLLLPDGTKVWLNAESTINIPHRSWGCNAVLKLMAKPISKSPTTAGVPLLSTRPTEKSRSWNKILCQLEQRREGFHGLVIEGSVKISAGDKSATLKPGYRAQFKDGEFTQSVIRSLETELWKDGIYYFKDKSFDELMEGLKNASV